MAMGGKKFALGLAITLLFALADGDQFDVRQHLGTTSRYCAGKATIIDAYQTPTTPPIGCTPVHLNLVARHGTRAPTKKRAKELQLFSERLEMLLKSAGHTVVGDAHESKQLPSWLKGWRSPWEGRKTNGQLTREGEEELYQLGKRIRERFPELFNEDYHPDIYSIIATQVPRASASAVAFGMGLFAGKGVLGPGQQQAFAVTSESRANDIHLRFHDTCQTYKDFKKMRKPAIEALLSDVYTEVSTSLLERYNLNFTTKDVATLWFLCKQEASLLDKTDQTCGLFSQIEVELLEWADDFELHHLKGYGESLNYRMGVPLLQNVVKSMEQVILAYSGPYSQGSVEKARLRFAHAETIIPFTCLLGLFLEASDIYKIQSEQSLQPPPKPPQHWRWRGSTVAPFAANTMLVLYKCPAKDASYEKVTSTGEHDNRFFVQILHNEKPASIPGCNGTDFCPFEVFKEKVAGSHLRHTFESLCTIKATPENCSLTCKLMRFFRRMVLGGGTEVHSCEDRAEL